MKRSGTIKVSHEPGDPPVATDTNWEKVASLTNAEVEAAAQADPDARPLTPGDAGRLRRLVNVKKLRERIGLTQEEFALRYRIPVGTLRDWEQRRKHPDAPARAYLGAIDKDPETVAALVAAA
jgi:putative transcriptional regulator